MSFHTFSEKQTLKKQKETFRKWALNICAGSLAFASGVVGAAALWELANSNPFGGNATRFTAKGPEPIENPPSLAGYRAKTGIHLFNAGALCEPFMPQAFESAYHRTSPLTELYDMAKESKTQELKDWANLIQSLQPMKNRMDQLVWVNAFFNARTSTATPTPEIANAESFHIPNLGAILTRKTYECGPSAFAKAMTLAALGFKLEDMSYLVVGVRAGEGFQENQGRVEHHIVLKVGDMILNNQNFGEPLTAKTKSDFVSKFSLMDRLNMVSEIVPTDLFFDETNEMPMPSLAGKSYIPLFEIRADSKMTTAYTGLREIPIPVVGGKIFVEKAPDDQMGTLALLGPQDITNTETSVERATNLVGLVFGADSFSHPSFSGLLKKPAKVLKNG